MTATVFLSWSFLGDPYKILCNIGAPNLIVDMIPVNNARYHDKERASGGHFTHRAVPENGGREHPQFCKRL